MMPNERLEFSAQDLGRLAKYLGDSDSVARWLDLHAVDAEDGRRVREAFYEGVNE